MNFGAPFTLITYIMFSGFLSICASCQTWPVCFYVQTIYIYIVFFGPVKPELGVIPSGQEIIHEWIFKFSW